MDTKDEEARKEEARERKEDLQETLPLSLTTSSTNLSLPTYNYNLTLTG
jgi:hypothetical protein